MLRRGNWRRGFRQRFARYNSDVKQSLTNRHVLWLHAVSVGEVNLCMRFIRALEPRVPNLKFVVSTTTTTGMGELRRRLPGRVTKIYYPIDRRRFVNRALRTINPQAIVLFEAEIWPNFIWRAQKLGIPLFLANARLSDRSYPRYKRFGFLFRELFAAFDGVGAQNQADAARLSEVGCRSDAIHVVGNLKFDAAKWDERRAFDVAAMLRQLGVPADAPILVGGSTHRDEEIILAEIAQKLRAQFPKLFLILAPRHFERCRDIAQKLREHGIKFIFRSEVRSNMRFREDEIECLLVNTTGELRLFYEQATVAFVGKSLTANGGQNPIEPGALGKAMVFGPNMQNFTEVARTFIAKNAAVQIRDAKALEKTISDLLADESRRAELGRNALEVIAKNQGAIIRTMEMILEKIKSRGIYIAPKES